MYYFIHAFIRVPTYIHWLVNSPAAPGLVTNLTAFAQNHTFVMVTWFLPHRINGLITKFAVKAKHARTGQTVRTLEVNAEDMMTVALPHCNVLHHTVTLRDLWLSL